MYNPFSLVGKTILVTGASSGIGRAAAIECSKLGAKVIISARNEQRLKSTFDNLEGYGHQLILCDLANPADVDSLVAGIPEIQGLINNAGIGKLLPIKFIKEYDLEEIFKINTVSPIMLIQKLVKKKKFTKGSSIVFTSSIAGLGSSAIGNTMYTASKGAISAFIKCAALELAPQKIRVNAVCPGMVNTHLIKSADISDETIVEDLKNYPLGRYGEPQDIALAMIFLLSDASSWVTGTNMIIDGGLTL